MIDKIIFTVTPIYSIPPRGAAAVETLDVSGCPKNQIP